MPGCYCSSTSRKQTFHIAKTRAVKLGQQSDKLHFLQALGHISSSHGWIFSNSYNALSCSSRKSWRACSNREMALPDPDTCCCTGSLAKQGSGHLLSSMFCHMAELHARRFIAEGVETGSKSSQKDKKSWSGPSESSGCHISTIVSLALSCFRTFRSLVQSHSLNLAAESLCMKQQMLRGPDLSTQHGRRGEGTTFSIWQADWLHGTYAAPLLSFHPPSSSISFLLQFLLPSLIPLSSLPVPLHSKAHGTDPAGFSLEPC